MNTLSKAFQTGKIDKSPVLVCFVTAGYPTLRDTIPIMLGMQAGGAGIIELGIPCFDPVADGPSIRETHEVALQNHVGLRTVFELLIAARRQGLRIPVILMGYYDTILGYGEDQAIQHAAEAGANGFIVVDLPFKKISRFRRSCRKLNIAYVPLVAPNTTVQQIKFLASIADGFIYVISKTGKTGSAVGTTMNRDLPSLVARVRRHATVPLAVGFGVATREHFEAVKAAGADGVVVGSRVIEIIKTSAPGGAAQNVESFCHQICSKEEPSVSNVPVVRYKGEFVQEFVRVT